MAKGTNSVMVGEGGSRWEFWAGHIAACGASGVPIAQYCRDQGLSYGGYHWWKRELKRRNLPAGFVEVRVPPAANAVEAAIEVVLSGRGIVRVHPGFDETTLARVLAVVERGGCCGGA